jgi:hypothetical protein
MPAVVKSRDELVLEVSGVDGPMGDILDVTDSSPRKANGSRQLNVAHVRVDQGFWLTLRTLWHKSSRVLICQVIARLS